MIFAIIAVIALGLLIAFFVRRWISNPVHELLNATQQVSQGNLNFAIKDLGDNEIGKLGISFNNMTKKLSEARMQFFQSDKMASLGRLGCRRCPRNK